MHQFTKEPSVKIYSQKDMDICLDKAFHLGEDMAAQAYRNVKAITRLSMFRWFSAGFLSGAGCVLLYQVIA